MRARALLLLLPLTSTIPSPPAVAQVGASQVYTALAPCRIFDTRVANPPGALAPGVAVAVNVVQGTDLASQGGSGGGCGVPGYGGSPTPTVPRAKAVMLNFVAVAPQGPGHLTAWASGVPPAASVLNYAAAAGLNIANGVVVPLDQDAIPGADFRLVAAVSATHVVIDVLGYFADRHPLAGEGRPGTAVAGTGPRPDVLELCVGPTGISFGMSEQMAPWGETPAVCPAGYWVCSAAERGTAPCAVHRTDTDCDARDCAHGCVDLLATNHVAWVADAADTSSGHYADEMGTDAGTFRSCLLFPAWCCTF
jgi:hypothetical protein